MQNKKKEKAFNIVICLVTTFIAFMVVVLITDIGFLTNDDLVMQMIANGLVSGKPDGHLVYSDFFWGGPISLLYKISKDFDWYSIGQLLCFFVGSFLIQYKIVSGILSRKIKVTVSVLWAVLWTLIIYRNIALLQFTVTASFMGAVAIFWAMFIDVETDEKTWIKEVLIVLALVSIGFNIREMSLLMMIPLAFTSWLGKWIACDKKDKLVNKRMLLFLLYVIITIGINKGVNCLYYQGEAWDKYLSFNSWTEKVIDYGGFIDYEENKEMYESVSISYEDYNAMANHFCQLLEEDINSSSLEAIYNATNIEQSFIESAIFFVDRSLNYVDRPINIVSYAMWICVFVLALLKVVREKNKNPLFELVCLFIGRMSLWAYLIYRGRFPDRITQSLYIAEFLVLLAIACRNTLQYKTYILYISCTLAVGALTLYLGIPKAISVKGECAARSFWATSFAQLLDYVSDHEDNLYFLDGNSWANFSRLKRVPENAGLAFLGSWIPKSPVEQELISSKGIGSPEDHIAVLNADNVYYVFRDSEITTEDYLIDYYSQYTNVKSEQVDYLTTDCGINYRIMKIYEDK